MNVLDRLIPTARLLERDSVDVAAAPSRVWPLVRHLDLASVPLARALFALRTLPSKLRGTIAPAPSFTIDDLRSTTDAPGFQILVDEPGRTFAVGAIGKVWRADIPFVHVPDVEAFRAFGEGGFVKVAWSIEVEALGEHDSRVTVEVRVDTTDDATWRKFRRYFRLIGPGSRFIRHALLSALQLQLGSPLAEENTRPLLGDDLLVDAAGQVTHAIDIEATPEAIWPWLLQMGCRRGGYYSYDLLDNGNLPSAREVHPELQSLRVGDVIPATPRGDDGFEVLHVERPRALLLGGLFDTLAGEQRPFDACRPEGYWQVTWSFMLEALDARTTRLHVRGRAACSPSQRLRLGWMRGLHGFMERAQLRHLKARAEGRLPRDGARDVVEGIGGAATMLFLLLTPFGRKARSHWGVDEATAARVYPGDDRVPVPRWMWTHGVEIDAPADEVWPWIAQIGADRAGFYSYQWLENLVGCNVRNAETLHDDWALHVGDAISLHPKTPPLPIVQLDPGRALVAFGAASEEARASGKPWIEASWAFIVEPLGPSRSRLISRYRASCSDDLGTRLTFGPTLVEPVGFVMDRRMLRGVKARVERRQREASSVRSFASV